MGAERNGHKDARAQRDTKNKEGRRKKEGSRLNKQ
jgi:hypothetical protein